jgi:hypothetical protein
VRAAAMLQLPLLRVLLGLCVPDPLAVPLLHELAMLCIIRGAANNA